MPPESSEILYSLSLSPTLLFRSCLGCFLESIQSLGLFAMTCSVQVIDDSIAVDSLPELSSAASGSKKLARSQKSGGAKAGSDDKDGKRRKTQPTWEEMRRLLKADGRQCQLCKAKDTDEDQILKQLAQQGVAISCVLKLWGYKPKYSKCGTYTTNDGLVCMVCLRVWRARYFPVGISVSQLKAKIGSDDKEHTQFESRTKEATNFFLENGGYDKQVDWDEIDKKVVLA